MKELRKECLRISNLGGDGNLQSVFSSLDLMWVLHDKILTVDDCFVLSKGQSTLGFYTILCRKGLIDKTELESFCKFDSRFSMQSDRTKFNGIIKVSAGSLGHGLPIAVGMALARKIKNQSGNIYCLVGDGEFNEGTMWEACMLASEKNLNNLCVIVDNNNSNNNSVNLCNRLQSFGFCIWTANGHNHKSIYTALSHMPSDMPLALVADTKRGYGCNSLMNDKSWFHRSPSASELPLLYKEVDDFEKTND